MIVSVKRCSCQEGHFDHPRIGKPRCKSDATHICEDGMALCRKHRKGHALHCEAFILRVGGPIQEICRNRGKLWNEVRVELNLDPS